MKEGWGSVPLGEVCRFDKRQGIYTGLPYVGMEQIESGTGRFLGDLSPVEVKSNTFRFSAEHVLYGRLRPYLNKVLVPEFDGHCSTEVFPLKPCPGLTREYLFYWLISDEVCQRINDTCTGARMPRADMNEVLGFEIPLPPLPEQKRIVAILGEAFEGIATAKANAEKSLRNAKAIFESHLQSIFGNPGDSWDRSTVGDCVRFIDYRGKTPDKTETGLRLITAKNVKMGFLQRAPEEFVAPETYEGWMTRGIPKKGDVLFTTEAPLANVAQLDTDDRVVFAQRIIIMQPDADRLDSTFLKYMLLSKPLQDRIHAKGTGATVKGIKASLLRTVELSFPNTLAEQKNMVTVMDDLSAETQRLSAVYEQKLHALDDLKKSLLHHAFTGQL